MNFLTSQNSLEDKQQEIKNFDIFLDFVKDLLNMNPCKRVTAMKAIKHPFITNYEKLNEKIDVKLPYFENEEKGIIFKFYQTSYIIF